MYRIKKDMERSCFKIFGVVKIQKYKWQNNGHYKKVDVELNVNDCHSKASDCNLRTNLAYR